LGGGNHFIELAKDSGGYTWLIIHSGSRNFGKMIAEFYQKQAKKELEKRFTTVDKDMEFLYFTDTAATGYLCAMDVAQSYASLNRKIMADKIIEEFNFSSISVVESVHNYIDFGAGIIRKGAISAQKGEACIIPFNSAEGSALCRGKGNPDWNFSAPHGAGRLYSRTKARELFDYKEYQKRLSDNGVYSTTANTGTLDECPMAYKSKDTILKYIEDTVEIVDMLKPVYNFKANEGGRR
jgi:RNA-splicing ligase RtcB